MADRPRTWILGGWQRNMARQYECLPGDVRVVELDREQVVPIIEQALTGDDGSKAPLIANLANRVFDALNGSGEA